MPSVASGSPAARLIIAPTRRTFSDCCARVDSGHAIAATPTQVMNSRRLMKSPRPEVGVRDFNLAHRKGGQSGFRPDLRETGHVGSKSGSAALPLCPLRMDCGVVLVVSVSERVKRRAMPLSPTAGRFLGAAFGSRWA